MKERFFGGPSQDNSLEKSVITKLKEIRDGYCKDVMNNEISMHGSMVKLVLDIEDSFMNQNAYLPSQHTALDKSKGRIESAFNIGKHFNAENVCKLQFIDLDFMEWKYLTVSKLGKIHRLDTFVTDLNKSKCTSEDALKRLDEFLNNFPRGRIKEKLVALYTELKNQEMAEGQPGIQIGK